MRGGRGGARGARTHGVGNSLMNRVKNNDCIESNRRGRGKGWYSSSFELVYCRPFNGTSIRLHAQYQIRLRGYFVKVRFYAALSTVAINTWVHIVTESRKSRVTAV